MQNPSDLATRATRKTTRFGVRDAKYNAAGAMHRVAWALQNSQAIDQKCEKPWGNQGFAAERTGAELFPIFPVFFTAGRKGLPPNDICRPCLKRATADLARDRN